MSARKRRSLAERFWPKVKLGRGCWLWQGCTDPKGYGYIGTGGHSGKVLSAHRASYMMEHGSIPDGMFVLHSCDTPSCVRPSHLFLGTARDNTHDMMRKGRARFAGRNHAAA
jgi:hypothetical protein